MSFNDDVDVYIDSIKNFDVLGLVDKANKLTLGKYGRGVSLERAIFLSWWCDKGDCAFCYMSSQKDRISDPLKARRRREAILGEVEVCRRLGWNIEFLSGGYGSFSLGEIQGICEDIKDITGDGVWLNVGVLDDFSVFGDEVVGVTGAVEAANPSFQESVCPSKPLDEISDMLGVAGDLGFKKAITIILGLGESVDDLSYLCDYIRDNGVDRVIFYSLNSHEDTVMCGMPQPASLYYAGVVASVRLMFPDLEIICGTWVDNLANIGLLVCAGANGITKFPYFKMFNSKYGRRVEDEVRWAGRELGGSFTDVGLLDVDWLSDREDKDVLEPFVKRYVDSCLKDVY